MGQEIQKSTFDEQSFRQFTQRLEEETRRLDTWLNQGYFDNRHWRCGFELEAWLLTPDFKPAPSNDRFLSLAPKTDVSPELAAFNIELNSPVFELEHKVFSSACRQLRQIVDQSRELAHTLDLRLALIGILPTLKADDLSLSHISASNRFAALNEQVLKQRRGKPLKIDIAGREHLHTEHTDVMLESATTSFQIHLQVPIDRAVSHYNASLIASAACVAVSANSPYLFGKQLWAETRIPLFEQAVDVGGFAGAAHGPVKRVSFGSGYLNHSMVEYFRENATHYPPLLPANLDEPAEELPHLRLHNGTLWRWNRPLIGLEDNGQLHLRIEHRVMAAGPSVPDMIANAAFYIGLTHALAARPDRYQHNLHFARVKDNFYKAAQHGLAARLNWLDDKTVPARQLVLDTLLPLAAEGLTELAIDPADRDYYLDLIRQRVHSGQTGADWQTRFVERTGRDMRLLTEVYLQNQADGRCVHDWELPAVSPQQRPLKLYHYSSYPEELLHVSARELHTLFKGPTLISLDGRREGAIFISVLLHGNEDSGFIAVQNLLTKYRDKPLPRTLHLLIGNIDAARYGLRRLNHQTDYNRAWPGTELPESAESRLLAEIHEKMRAANLYMSLDLHNNSGINPHYACVNRLDSHYLHLALLFSRTVVYFTQPRGVQSLAMSELCPAVTVECGKVGDLKGITQAEHFIEQCLHLERLPADPVSAEDIDLFHTVAQVRIPEKIRFTFDDDPAHINFSSELEFMNFREITPGTPWGDCARTDGPPLSVRNEKGEDVYHEYFEVENGLLRIRKHVMPSMLTCDERIIRQDCLCYLMERIQP